VSILVAISAFKCQKSGTSGICLTSVDVVTFDTMTGIHRFGLSSVVTNLAIRFLGIVSVIILEVSVSGSVHLLKI
jgi:hypothetical protein